MDTSMMNEITLELGLEIALGIVGLLICLVGLVSMVVSLWLAI